MDRKCCCRRSRCRVCRKHFHADQRAPKQKVCSASCRLVWRHKHAKQRRALDLEGHREADRARQQAWRDARRAATGGPSTSNQRETPATSSQHETPSTSSQSQRVTPSTSSQRVTPATSGALSRAGFAAQSQGKKEEILLAWDKASRLSRASLERDLAKILGENASILGQLGQGSGAVTRREGRAKPRRSLGNAAASWDKLGPLSRTGMAGTPTVVIRRRS